MKVSYGEGIATHTGPESCGAVRKDSVEALTGERTGRAFSRESTFLRSADAVGVVGRQHRQRRYRETLAGSARSETPCTYGNISRGSREVPCSPGADGAPGRIGKSKDVRR
jgi:RNA-directed DNA polymerase